MQYQCSPVTIPRLPVPAIGIVRISPAVGFITLALFRLNYKS